MGAFILFPVLLFSVFITSLLGFVDFVHVSTQVHAGAQTAVTAAAQDIRAPNTQGVYHGIKSQMPVDMAAANTIVSELLTGKPYITSWTCGIQGNDYSCTVDFKVSMPILGNVNSSTSATASDVINAQIASSAVIKSTTVNYTGSTTNVTVPTGTKYLIARVSGAGGGGGSNDANTYGGTGGFVQASIPISSGQTSLVALVGGGGSTSGAGSGGGGGLSGIFTGTPSQADALIIAGGGGGGANDAVENTQSNGTGGSSSPTLPYTPSMGAHGGAGYGGGGDNYGARGADEPSGIAFGLVAPSPCGVSGPGGYGGGADGGCGWGGGGAGGVYTGGQGGNGWNGSGTPDGSGGQGGTSYVVSSGTTIMATSGGGTGGYGSAGGNGSIVISFYN